MIKYFISVLALLSLFTGSVEAGEAAPLAEDPAIEARMLAMAQELRCLVCQNQTVAASDSDFSNDIRREMRAMMKNGMSNEQIRDFLVQRYGDFILFKPPVKTKTLPLWFGPIVLLIIGLAAGVKYMGLYGLAAFCIATVAIAVTRKHTVWGLKYVVGMCVTAGIVFAPWAIKERAPGVKTFAAVLPARFNRCSM